MTEDLQLLEPQQVADLLRVHVQFVYQRIKTGAINVVRVGRLPRITSDELRRFISEGEAREELHQRELSLREQVPEATIQAVSGPTSELDQLAKNLSDADAWRAAGCPPGLITGFADKDPPDDPVTGDPAKAMTYVCDLCSATTDTLDGGKDSGPPENFWACQGCATKMSEADNDVNP